MTPQRRAAACGIAMLCATLCGGSAHANPQPAPPSALRTGSIGFARKIPRSLSASRDAPAFSYLAYPRPTLTAFTELGLVSIARGAWSLRVGFVGGLELESETEQAGSRFLLPVGDIRFWRGYNGFTAAYTDDRISRALGPAYTVELGLMARHESEHYTGSNRGGDGTDYSDRGQSGDIVVPEVAVRWQRGAFVGHARAQLKWFLPDRSSYSIGPGVDLHGRYRLTADLSVFGSLFAETQRGARTRAVREDAVGTHPIQFPNANVVRSLFGAAFPGRLGATLLYGYATIGHRKGLAVYSRERVLGIGARFALGEVP